MDTAFPELAVSLVKGEGLQADPAADTHCPAASTPPTGCSCRVFCFSSTTMNQPFSLLNSNTPSSLSSLSENALYTQFCLVFGICMDVSYLCEFSWTGIKL